MCLCYVFKFQFCGGFFFALFIELAQFSDDHLVKQQYGKGNKQADAIQPYMSHYKLVIKPFYFKLEDTVATQTP